jgi:hypothetical protein
MSFTLDKFPSVCRKKPNASLHLLPEAGATQERTLEAVRCKALFGADSASRIAGVSSPTLGFLRPRIGPAHHLRVFVPLIASV